MGVTVKASGLVAESFTAQVPIDATGAIVLIDLVLLWHNEEVPRLARALLHPFFIANAKKGTQPEPLPTERFNGDKFEGQLPERTAAVVEALASGYVRNNKAAILARLVP